MAVAGDDVSDERDRLRAVIVELYRQLYPRTPADDLAILDGAELLPGLVRQLVAERDELTEAANEYDHLLSRLTVLLTGTANALKGDPGPLKLHDWSGLPAVATAVVTERDRLRAVVRRLVDMTSTVVMGDSMTFAGGEYSGPSTLDAAELAAYERALHESGES